MSALHATSRLTPPIKWHGGKHYLARRYVGLMLPHTHYVEPYFGGGAVMLAKNPNGVSEVANDTNGWLTNFWTVLASPVKFEEFRRKVEAMPFSQRLWESAAAAMTAQPDVRQHGPVKAALMFFVRCRQSLAGRMASFAPLSSTRTRRGQNEQAAAWWTAVEGLPDVRERLKRVVVLNRPALEVITSHDGPTTLFYLDPPYLPETRTSPAVYGQFEMSVDDHAALLDVIKQCCGKVMISGYDSALYRRELADWNRHSFDLPNNAAAGATKARKLELVWCNF